MYIKKMINNISITVHSIDKILIINFKFNNNYYFLVHYTSYHIREKYVVLCKVQDPKYMKLSVDYLSDLS